MEKLKCLNKAKNGKGGLTIQKKKVLTFLTITLLIIASFYAGHSLASPSNTFTISSGIYPGSPTYTIYKEGSTYYAKDAYGAIDFSGTNATAVIQQALNSLTPDRTWKEKVVLKGDFVLTDSIYVPSLTVLDLTEARLYASNGLNKKMIVNKNAEAGGDTLIDIIGGYLYGNKAYQTAGEGIHLKSASYCTIKGVNVYQTKAEGILLTTCHNILIDDVFSSECGITGLTIEINSHHVSVKNSQLINNEYYGLGFEGVNGACYQCDVSNVICAGNLKNGVLVDRCRQIELSNVLSISNGESGFAIAGCWDCALENCIAQGNGLDGFSVYQIGTVISKSITFKGCHSIKNGANNVGFRIQANCRDIVIDGCIAKNEAYCGIRFESASYNKVIGCNLIDDQTDPTQDYGVEEIGTSDYNEIAFCLFYGNVVQAINKLGEHTKIHHNIGFITENSGTATISSGTSVIVTHGLAGTPTVVIVTPRSTGYGSFAVTARTSTTFTITVTVSGTYTFDWYAEYYP